VRDGFVVVGLTLCLTAALPGFGQNLCPQVANYTMDVRLDPAGRMVEGRETLLWTNTSADALGELWFHLYWNAFANNASTFLAESRRPRREAASEFRESDWGYSRVESIRIRKDPAFEGLELLPSLTFRHPDDANEHDRTVFSVNLPKPLAPGESIVLDIRWEARVPRPLSRTGVVGDYYFFGQWFPKIGVYEDGRWNCHQFHDTSEFFADYGTYDVRLTLPRAFVVGATGRRLEHVPHSDGTATYRFYQESVHDFAWTASPRFLEYRRPFAFAPGRETEIILLLQPEHRRFKERYLKAVMAAVKYSSQLFGDYPYGTVTCVDPAFNSRSGGMEYPTLFAAGVYFLDPEGSGDPEGVTIHEFGHGYFYGLVGSNEFENPWMDEGFTSFLESEISDLAYGPKLYTRTYFGVPVLFPGVRIPLESEGLSEVRMLAPADVMQRFAWQFRDAGSYGANSYAKAEVMLRTLKRFLGDETFGAMIKDYSRSHWFKHPRPRDFYETVARHAGRDMSWFLDQFVYGAGVCDYALGGLDSRPAAPLRGWFDGRYLDGRASRKGGPEYESTVLVLRRGEIRIPVEVQVTFEDGRTFRETWDGQYDWKRFRYRGPSRLVLGVVDPDFKLAADVDRTNNSLKARPNRLAPWKWAANWLAWLQHALEVFSIFGG
jgi:hypothetical protein